MNKILTLLCGMIMMSSLTTKATPIEVLVIGFDETTEEYSYNLKPFYTEITRNADGSYTLLDFFNSGHPATFHFDQPALYQINYLYMCGNIFEDPENQGFPYLMTSEDYEVDNEGYPVNDDDYMTCYSYIDIDDNTPTKISRVFTDQTDTILASYIAYQDREVMGTDYYACICTSGYTEEYEYNMWYYLILQFNEIKIPSGIEEIQKNTYPVEYYNLNGMRVENPSNGIFIRKQGSEVKKVIINK